MLLAIYEKILQQPRQRHPWPLPSFQDRLDDVGCVRDQAVDAGHVGRCGPFALGQLGDGGELARLQHMLPEEAGPVY